MFQLLCLVAKLLQQMVGWCAYLKGLEEDPPEAEAYTQKAEPTTSSTVPAQVDALQLPAFSRFPSSMGDIEGE